MTTEPEELPLTSEEQQEMDRRLADLDENPGVGDRGPR